MFFHLTPHTHKRKPLGEIWLLSSFYRWENCVRNVRYLVDYTASKVMEPRSQMLTQVIQRIHAKPWGFTASSYLEKIAGRFTFPLILCIYLSRRIFYSRKSRPCFRSLIFSLSQSIKCKQKLLDVAFGNATQKPTLLQDKPCWSFPASSWLNLEVMAGVSAVMLDLEVLEGGHHLLRMTMREDWSSCQSWNQHTHYGLYK